MCILPQKKKKTHLQESNEGTCEKGCSGKYGGVQRATGRILTSLFWKPHAPAITRCVRGKDKWEKAGEGKCPPTRKESRANSPARNYVPSPGRSFLGWPVQPGEKSWAGRQTPGQASGNTEGPGRRKSRGTMNSKKLGMSGLLPSSPGAPDARMSQGALCWCMQVCSWAARAPVPLVS